VLACPLCQHEGCDQFECIVFHGTTIENQICQQCGFVYQSPRMTVEELDQFYARSYRQLYQGEGGPTSKDLAIQAERADHLLEFTLRSIPKVNKFLDIGSSAGTLLERFKALYQCRAIGVEPGVAYRQYAQEKGLHVFTDLTEIDAEKIGPFDLVSMIHVLEHIPDPVFYLNELRQGLIHPNGALLVEVPNLWIHDSFEVAHLSSFSPHTLKELLKQGGFRMTAFKSHGFPRSRLLPLYLTALAKPMMVGSRPQVVPEKWVRLKRDLGMFYRRIIQRLFPALAWVIRET
jgi:2-polyprenyl-3-methyl-5-hydroxy-6-metoxy-1,4-benzoquinol methylase